MALLVVIGLIMSSVALASEESPVTFTFQGRLMMGGLPIPDTAATFKFQILDNAANCIIYSEQQAVDSSVINSGIFSTQIGSVMGDPKRVVGEDPNLSMAEVFANDGVAYAG
ncbi:MAG: hypothetical protein IT289_13255, partial [Oligoflexia bacterium]|nr:hypothetical protein [Oligoflexia bacterium]